MPEEENKIKNIVGEDPYEKKPKQGDNSSVLIGSVIMQETRIKQGPKFASQFAREGDSFFLSFLFLLKLHTTGADLATGLSAYPPRHRYECARCCLSGRLGCAAPR